MNCSETRKEIFSITCLSELTVYLDLTLCSERTFEPNKGFYCSVVFLIVFTIIKRLSQYCKAW